MYPNNVTAQDFACGQGVQALVLGLNQVLGVNGRTKTTNRKKVYVTGNIVVNLFTVFH